MVDKLRDRTVQLKEKLRLTRKELKRAQRALAEAEAQQQKIQRAHDRSLRDLALLYDLETSMGRAHSLSELARSAIELTAEACAAQAGALLYKPPREPATLYVFTPGTDDVRTVLVKPGEGVTGRAMSDAALVVIDRKHRTRDPKRVRELLGVSVKSALAAPLQHDERGPCGALALYNQGGRPSRFSEDDAALLKLVCANVSTELRLVEARQRREHAQRLEAIGRVLSGVLHDMRTPLAVISGYMQVMEREDRAEQRSAFAAKARRQFDIITAMQRNLLSYARGETTLLVRKVAVVMFMERIARHAQARAAQHGIEIEVDLQERGMAFFDEDKMGLALGNLISNAIEAMGEGGVLTLSSRADNHDLVLCVQDTGPGIPRSIRGRLFEPFITSGKTDGTGLGLANVKAILDEHSGAVAVKSSRRGSCFTLRLPGALRHGPTAGPPPSS